MTPCLCDLFAKKQGVRTPLLQPTIGLWQGLLSLSPLMNAKIFAFERGSTLWISHKVGCTSNSTTTSSSIAPTLWKSMYLYLLPFSLHTCSMLYIGKWLAFSSMCKLFTLFLFFVFNFLVFINTMWMGIHWCSWYCLFYQANKLWRCWPIPHMQSILWLFIDWFGSLVLPLTKFLLLIAWKNCIQYVHCTCVIQGNLLLATFLLHSNFHDCSQIDRFLVVVQNLHYHLHSLGCPSHTLLKPRVHWSHMSVNNCSIPPKLSHFSFSWFCIYKRCWFSLCLTQFSVLKW